MMKRIHLRVFVGFLTVLLSITSLMEGKTRKGDKLLKDAEAAEARQDWDKALDLYQQAVVQDPAVTAYLIGMRRSRFEAGQKHVNAGQKLRAEGKLEEALKEFEKALIADPSSAIAVQEMRRTKVMLDTAPQAGASPEDRGLTPAERARRDADRKVDSMQAPPDLKPITSVIPTLKMNNQPPKVLYETVGKLAGVNVVFDSQYSANGRNFNVDLNNSSIDQAFDYLAVLTHTFWKPISTNTIFVSEDNITKRNEYADEVVKVFYVTNATSVQEFQEIATAIRTVPEIRRVFTYAAQKAIIVRGTVDQVSLAEKLIHDLDKPKSEVVIDLIVMQVNSEHTRALAATLASAGTAGLNVPISFTGTGSSSTTTSTTSTTGTTTTGTTTPTSGATGALTLQQLGHLSSAAFSTSLPGGLLEAMLTDTHTKVLNTPQVRASDGMKVELKIGNRIPYATGSFQPGVGTVGVSPLVSTQFNYVDTGVNVAITPQVHSSSEVTLHVEVTVSSVTQYLNLGGLSQPVIGQNVNNADLRMREGEVNLMGGLSTVSDSSTVNGIPGLVNIPILGKILFGSENLDKVHSELVIALIPHIVRTPDYTAENLRGIYAGNDTTIKLNYVSHDSPAAVPAGANPAPAGAVVTTPAQPVMPGQAGMPPVPAGLMQPFPGSPPPSSAPASSQPALSPPAPGAPAAAAAPPLSGDLAVTFAPATIQAAPSASITVNVQVANVNDLFSGSPIKIKFDPSQLRLNDIVAGEMWSRDGVRTTAVKDIRNDLGEATLTVSRLPGLPGISGSGSIATLTFAAVGPGSSSVTITDLGLKDSKLQAVSAKLSELPVKVQ